MNREGSSSTATGTPVLPAFSTTSISDTSTWCLQGSPTGRLLKYSLTGETTVLAQGLWFANGVALSQDGDFLIIAETCSMTLHRHWLRGPKVSGMPAASVLTSCLYADVTLASQLLWLLPMGQQCTLRVQEGKTEVLLRGLPGFPDGVSLASDGNFWVSLPSSTVPVVKMLSSR